MFFDSVSDLFGARGSSHSYPGGFSGAISRSGRYNSMENCAIISRYCSFILFFPNFTLVVKCKCRGALILQLGFGC